MATLCSNIKAIDEDNNTYGNKEVIQTRVIVDTQTRLTKKRIWELDFLRGFCILLMVIDHLLFDLADGGMFASTWLNSGNAGAILAVQRAQNYMFGIVTPQGEPVRDIVHIIVLWIFFLLCGISCYFSRNNIKRTAQVSACAGLITLATFLFDKLAGTQMIVRFGVLHMLAFCIAIYTFVELVVKLTIKNKNARQLTISLICLAIGIACLIWSNKLDALYDQRIEEHLYYANPNGAAFLHDIFYYNGYSSDYFGLLNYLYMVMFGAAFAPLIYRKKQSFLPKLDGKWNKPFCFFGRHTLIIVITHQLIITGLLALISYLFITPGSFGL